jgi:hypothetical protein
LCVLVTKQTRINHRGKHVPDVKRLIILPWIMNSQGEVEVEEEQEAEGFYPDEYDSQGYPPVSYPPVC